jgi:hypothetical protein
VTIDAGQRTWVVEYPATIIYGHLPSGNPGKFQESHERLEVVMVITLEVG